MLVYKILLPAEWAEFESAGRFVGSPLDVRDGFIHCSSRDQVAGTALRYFSAEPELVVVAIDATTMGEWLRWETAGGGGGPFPHVYAPLPRAAVVAVHRVGGAASVDEVIPRT